MGEYILKIESSSDDELFTNIANMYSEVRSIGEEIVRCRDCKHLDDSEYKRCDSVLAENYGEPPLFCDLLSFNEWRMDGDRRVAETSFAEVEPDGFCAWGERRGDA